LLRTPYGKAKLASYEVRGKGASPEVMGTRDKENIVMSTGCTACQAIITQNEIIVSNAGDSRAVLALKSKNPKQYTAQPLSTDHKPNLPGEKLRIEQAGGFVSDNRVKCNLSLSRAIGDHEFKSDKNIKSDMQMVICTPEISKAKVEDAEFLIIACDGIWDCLTNQQAVDYIGNLLNKH
jgi:serine/threonine protein phosphatase PrpC